MKKLLSIFAVLFTVAIIAPSCTSDEGFEEIVINSELDQVAPDGSGGTGSGGGETPPGGGG
ncbi:hypothetical protein [Marinoscillum sp. MHG1-6]|uniref:hypothetical protein n=1 Tax=Marinoscillum sp. MHG1-6 TaxID=2959627 RepID=UPI002158566A|nr:hypothetical protein [Marinoscillum sp. MHG1-6]